MNTPFLTGLLLNDLRYQFGLIACLISAVLGGHALAQPAPNTNGTPVHLIVTVEPKKGSEVPVVNREDVMVYEGKNRDQVTDWVPAEGDHAGLEFFVLIDDGASSALDTQLRDIKKFIAGLPATAEVGVAYMQNGIARIEQNLTNDHDLAAKAIRLPLGYFAANASPYFSLSDLVKHWQPDGNRHEVVMISSGSDPYYASGDAVDVTWKRRSRILSVPVFSSPPSMHPVPDTPDIVTGVTTGDRSTSRS